MVTNEDILKVVQMNGPIIPNELKKIIKAGDTILLGAILSELKTMGKIKITHTKVGSSPAYYTSGTEVRLQNLIKYLNEKDRQTAELLRQKKIMKDSELSPLVRVSLRNIRDFAKPLEVSVKGQKEIYWKWYMVSTKEANEIILKKVTPKITPKKIEKPVPKPAEKQEVKKEEKIKEKKEKSLPAAGMKDEVQKELGRTKEDLEKEKDPFFRKLLHYFNQNDIDILDYQIIRKKSDIEFALSVPSRIGSQEYYCKAKSKKKLNDGDLSSAYVHGQAKKLPVIFIITGEMTKKAKEMLAKDFKGMIVKKI